MGFFDFFKSKKAGAAVYRETQSDSEQKSAVEPVIEG